MSAMLTAPNLSLSGHSFNALTDSLCGFTPAAGVPLVGTWLCS